MGRPAQQDAATGVPATTDVEVTDADVLLRLSGPGGAHLRPLGVALGLSVGLRGNTIRLHGPAADVTTGERVLGQLLGALEQRQMSEADLERAARTLRDNPDLRLRELYDDVVIVTARGKKLAPKGIAQQAYVQAIRDADIVFGIGPAGTGKTYLAMAMAVRALQRKMVKRLVLTRPAVEAGEKLGFLPGDLAEKVDPYLRPLYDALNDMMDVERAQALMSRGTIEVAPLAFMRGRTLNDCFVILDEAQNTTPEQMKMFLTRLGFDSKTVITGDVTQVDLPEGKPSGLRDAESLLRGIEGIRFSHFTDADVVRHPLVRQIVRAYDERDARRQRTQEARATGAEDDG